MTPKQRFLAALNREVPDMVPVAPLIHHRFAHKVLGRSGWRAVFKVHKMVGSIHFRGPIGVDFKVDWPERRENRLVEEQDARRVYEETIQTPKGLLTSKRVEGIIPHDPLVGRTVEYFVKAPEDWRVYKDYLEEWLDRAEPDISRIAEAYRIMGEQGVPSVGVGSAFSHLGSVRGMEGLLFDLCDLPDLIKEVMEVAWRIKEMEIKAFLESPAEVAWYDVCWATGARMSPQFFQSFSLPEMQKAADLVKGKDGKYIGFYTLGKLRAILPMIVDTGAHFVETFEPNEGDISLREAKEGYGDRICVMGNYDCVVLARGTAEEAKRETLRCLSEGMEGGGYVLVTGDEVPADAKMENLKVMVQTVQEYGRY